MVIIFGFGKKRHPVGGFRMMCNNCGGPSVQVGMITKSSFTLFWVPFVPLGSSKELICARCKTVTTASTFPWKEEVTPEKFPEELMRSNQMLAAQMTMRPGPIYSPPGMPMPGPPPGAVVVPPPPPPLVQCPRCKGSAEFIAQYGRHYCRKCKQYV